jgi:hypothetical protein
VEKVFVVGEKVLREREREREEILTGEQTGVEKRVIYIYICVCVCVCVCVCENVLTGTKGMCCGGNAKWRRLYYGRQIGDGQEKSAYGNTRNKKPRL